MSKIIQCLSLCPERRLERKEDGPHQVDHARERDAVLERDVKEHDNLHEGPDLQFVRPSVAKRKEGEGLRRTFQLAMRMGHRLFSTLMKISLGVRNSIMPIQTRKTMNEIGALRWRIVSL